MKSFFTVTDAKGERLGGRYPTYNGASQRAQQEAERRAGPVYIMRAHQLFEAVQGPIVRVKPLS